jgi:hypothetical protein
MLLRSKRLYINIDEIHRSVLNQKGIFLSAYEVTPVQSRGDFKNFLNLPWEIYSDDPLWVPPLKKMVAQLLTPGKHPFWENAERALFLVYRNGHAVGRIAAIIDHSYNTYHDEKSGKWGFFECIDDVQASDLLFEAVSRWLSDKGMAYMHGPFNPSTNYEIGMLAEGWQSSPVVMMTYNPKYYLDLVEASGQAKEKDLYAFRFLKGCTMPSGLQRLTERIISRNDITLRAVDKRRLHEEVKLMNSLYCQAWADNWGFVPATDAEIDVQAEELKSVLEPELAFFLYVKDEPVGVCVVLPDFNYLLKKLDGKIGLFGLIKALRYKSKINGLRCILLGIKPGYRSIGVPLVAVNQLFQKATLHPRYEYMEVSWTLEDNQLINGLIEKYGGELYRKYRIFRKGL